MGDACREGGREPGMGPAAAAAAYCHPHPRHPQLQAEITSILICPVTHPLQL